MALLGTLFFWNPRLSVLLGMPINFALVWLILNKTPKEMRVYSRVLLQTAFLDILMLASSAIEQPVGIL